MAAKKGGRIIVAMQCSECKATNYHTMISKAVTPKLQRNKHCSKCKKHTEHNSREKLK